MGVGVKGVVMAGVKKTAADGGRRWWGLGRTEEVKQCRPVSQLNVVFSGVARLCLITSIRWVHFSASSISFLSGRILHRLGYKK